MKKNSKRIQGTRWAFVFYPDDPNCPDNYSDIIRLWHIDYAYSPVHCPDPDNKKPHIHLYLEFSHNMGVSTIIDQFMTPLGVGNLQPELVYNPPQYCKYLTHMLDKWVDENGNRKFKYDPKHVVFSGVPYIEYIMTEKGTSSTLEEIALFIRSNQDISSYRELYLYSLDNGLILWQDFIEHHVYLINSIVR